MELEYKISAWNSRYDSYIDPSRAFNDMFDEEEAYSFKGGFQIYAVSEDDFGDEESREKVATAYGIFFDEVALLNEGESMENVADMIDADTHHAISTLIESNIYKKDIDENKMFLPLFSCYIEHVYVEPAFREQGFGDFIFRNFDAISTYCFNAPIRCLVICPKPQEREQKDGITVVRNIDDPDNIMMDKMVKRLRKNGYKKLGKSEFYAVNCAL